MVRHFYIGFDAILMVLVWAFVDVQLIRDVVKREILAKNGKINESALERETFLEFIDHVDMIQGRVPTFLTHVSVLVAIVIFAAG